VAFISDDEAAAAVDPCEGSLDHPSVLSQLLAAFDAPPCDTRGDASLAQVAAASVEVVALAGMQLGRPFAWPPALVAHGMDGVAECAGGELAMIVPVRPEDG